MRTRTILSALAVAIVSAACSKSPKLSSGADTGLALATSKEAKDSLIHVKDSLLAERQRQLSEQSSLIGDAATSARLVSEIASDLSKVRGLKVAGDTTQPESAIHNASQELATVQKKVNAVIARLNASEAHIRRMRKDSTTHAAFDSTQVAQLRDYEKSIGDLRTSVDQQRTEIAALRQSVDSMTKVNVALSARNDSVTARVNAMAAFEDSVFVAVGTEKELIDKGIIRKEGGTAILFGRGKTLVPARALDLTAFEVKSKSHDLNIALPRADKKYQVVSRQSLAYTDASAAKDPLVRGQLNITDPGKFWAPSKYLILVQR